MDMEDLQPPQEPAPEDCCGSGCARCVWDVYFDKLAEFEHRRKARGSDAGKPVKEARPSPLSHVQRPSAQSYHGGVVLRFVERGVSDEDNEDCDGSVPGSGSSRLDEDSRYPRQLDFCPAGTCNVLGSSTDSPPLRLARVTISAPCGGEPAPEPVPGDVVEFLRGNAEAEVTALLRRLLVLPDRDVVLMPSPFAPPECFPPWLPRETAVPVVKLLRWYTDINSAACVRPPLFELLAKHTKNPEQLEELHRLASAHSASEMHTNALGPRPSLLTILTRFSDAKPPLARLLEHLPPLRPRRFSVAGTSGGGTELLFRVVQESDGFRGHVSPYITPADIASLWVRRGQAKVDLRVAPEVPLVVVAGGAGLAPLRFAMQHRATAARATQIGRAAATTLYLGARTAGEVALMLSEWELPKGTATRVAVSRPVPPQDPVRVPELLRADADVLRETLGSRGGALIACGPHGLMQDVKATISALLGDNWWCDAVTSRRVVIDSWSNAE